MQSAGNWFKSWKLLSWRTAVVVAIVGYGLVGFFLVPVIVKNLIVKVARERTGREVTVEEVRCNPFTLSLTIRGFSMPDRPGSTMLTFDEFYANAQVSSLFRWAATLKELRVENPYLGLRRFADGSVNILELMEDIEARTPPDEEPEEAGGLPRALLHHILVTGSTIEVDDFAREEPLQAVFGPSTYELHRISTIPDKKGANDFVIGLQDGGTVGVRGEVVVEPLGLEGTVTIDRIQLESTWAFVKPYFEFDLVGGGAGGRFDYAVELRDDGVHVRVSDLDYRIEDLELKLRDSDANLLEVPLITVTGLNGMWPEAEVSAAAIEVGGAEAFLWLEPDGTPSWAGLVPKETQEQVVKTYREVEEAFPWQIDIDQFEIKGAKAHFEDRTFDEPVRLDLENANVALTDIVTGPGHRWGLEASASLFGEATATAEGFVATGPMRLETGVGVEGLDLGRLQPYVERFAPVELRAGVLDSKGIVVLDPKGDGPVAAFAGDLDVVEIDLRETVIGSRVLQWGRVETRGIDAAVGPLGLDVASIDIYGAGIDIVVSEDGRVNLIELLKVMAETSESEADTAEVEDFEMPHVAVQTLTLHGCSGAYTDRTLTPPFTLALDPVDGTIRGISTEGAGGARLEIEAPVRSGGRMDLEGEMDLFDPKRLTDLTIDVRQTVLPPVSPMSVRYIGHPITEGSVDIGLEYEITNSDLVGKNRFVTSGLELGDKVEGEGMVNLPFKLGVSLLTDKEGHVTLEFPIEGNLDDPAFGIGNAIGSAAKEIVGELVKSPFRLLGKLGGGSGDEDFGHVEFEAGSAELAQTEQEKLQTLAAGANQRPELALLVEGSWDGEADTIGLKEAAFEARMAEKEPSRELFESMFLETQPREALDALLAENTATDEATGEPVLDETTYYRGLRAKLIEAQPVDAAEVEALAGTRAETIREFLVSVSGIDPSRVQVLEPVPVEPSGERWVSCRLDVAAGH